MDIILKLDKNVIKPVITLNHSTMALFDTGADIPIWLDGEEGLLDEYPDAQRTNPDTSISGFGGSCPGALYKINFVLESLTYPQMPIFVPNNEVLLPYDMILPAAMFCGLRYVIDDTDKCIYINNIMPAETVRNLKAYDSNGNIHVLAGTN